VSGGEKQFLSFMLSPSGTNFREPTVMGNIFVRR